MRINKTFILVFLLMFSAMFSLVALPFLTQSRMTFYTFEITVPDEVNANLGETVEIEGEILVTGMYWLHNFDLNASDLPYEYKIEPAWWEHVRILREWNPEVGVYRVPEKFNMTINVPTDASGAHLVTITGQEHHSFREVSNTTYFVLTIGAAPAEMNISVSDIFVPEFVKQYEPFELTFKVDNHGALDVTTTISAVVPEGWVVDEPSKTIEVKGGSSEIGVFEITPTTTAGDVSLFVEYPFKGEIINFTKVGPYLVPTEEIPTTTTLPQPFYVPIANFIYSLATPVIDRFEEVAGVYTVPITVGIIIVLLLVIVWLLVGIARFTRGKGRGEPETESAKKKKSVEPGEPGAKSAGGAKPPASPGASGLWASEAEPADVGMDSAQVKEV